MGKRYNPIHAANMIGLIQDVSHGHQKDVNAFNAKQAYRSEEIVIPRNIMEQIYNIPSSIKREWSRMSRAEKIVYGTILLSTAVGLGIAADYKYNDGKTVKWTKDKAYKGSSFVKEKYANAFAPAPAVVVPVANESAVATPAATPTPDYYDEEFKVGIVIEGDPQFKQNVTNLIRTWKEITPDDYKDKYPYAPKKIMKSPDNRFNYYGGAFDDDVIQIAESTEKRGGSNNINEIKVGVSSIRAEWHNAKRSKTGVGFASGYDAEIDSNRALVEYRVMIGLMTQEQANAYLESISKRINENGTYKN